METITDNWMLDAYNNIRLHNNEELPIFEENSQSAFWDDVIDSTTNVPGILNENNLVVNPSTEVSGVTHDYTNQNYISRDGDSLGSFSLPNEDLLGSNIIPSAVENIYDKIFENLAEDDQTTEAEPSSAVATKLYPHQKQALNWMIAKENRNALPPFWEQHAGYCLNTVTNEKRKKVMSIHGGILADDMGLGKTLEMIALIMTNFVNGKPLAYPLSDCDQTPFEFKDQKKDKTKRDVQKKLYDYFSASSSKFTTNKTVEKDTSNDASFSALCSQHDSNGGLCSQHDSSGGLCSQQNSNGGLCSQHDSSGGLCSQQDSSGGLCSQQNSNGGIYNQQDSAGVGSSERVTKRLHINDDKGWLEMNKNHSPAKYGRLDENEESSDDFEDIKPLPKLEDLVHESFLCNNSFVDIDETFLSTKLKQDDSLSRSHTEDNSVKPDGVVEVSDSDSVITILDSDEEDELSNSKPSCSKKDTADEEEELSNSKPSCSKKDTDYEALLETIMPAWQDKNEDSKQEVFQDYDPLTGRCITSGPRGTLIICPTSVLYNWKEQFKQHVDKTVHLNFYQHYGKNRNVNVEFMKEQDVVITTYHTVIADNKNPDRGPLYNTKWLRIVLDEGHTIRNPKTCTAKVIFELKAQRKWVLSGTPIQNSLEDLWSIINFLKVEPLTDKRCWNRTIAYPMANKDDAAMQRVFHLMRNLSLRRSKTQQVNGKPVLDLPARNVVLKKLTLNQDQRKSYDLLEKEGRILIRKYIKDKTVQHHLYEIYVAQLRLRQFCCHPKLVYKAVEEELSHNKTASLTAENSFIHNTPCEEDGSEQVVTCPNCSSSPKNAVVTLHGDVYCWTCIQINPALGHHQAVTLIEQETINAAEKKNQLDRLSSACQADEECIICANTLRNAVITSKGHIYCRACFEKHPDITQVNEEISATTRKKLIGELLIWLESDEEYKECPICYMKSVEIGPQLALITFCGHQFCSPCIEKLCTKQPQPTCPICRQNLDTTRLIKVPQKLTEGLDNIDEWKSSAKLDALMVALTDLQQQDPSIKSIVVSQFTSLLDLIAKALGEKSFVFSRLDGKMSQSKRLQAMQSFADTSIGSPTVFLLSLKAGGVGINLIAASRVFLMEPAWNPAAEEQCFDRCHRLGQTRDVEITKFIIENSVEENMLKLQDKKRGLMTGAFLKKLTKEQRRHNYISDLLEFFQSIE